MSLPLNAEDMTETVRDDKVWWRWLEQMAVEDPLTRSILASNHKAKLSEKELTRFLVIVFNHERNRLRSEMLQVLEREPAALLVKKNEQPS